MKIIVDTNILFNALLREGGKSIDVLLAPEPRDSFFIPRYAIVELFKHKEKIIKHSKLAEETLLEVLHLLLKQLQFVDESMISMQSFLEARELVKNIDEKDLFFVAMCLEFDAHLWTMDKELIRGLQQLGFHHFYIP